MRRAWALLALLCLAGFASLAAAMPAFALSARGHAFAFPFGAPGKGAGQFTEPDGVAVNTTTGDVYVADRKRSTVSVWEPVLKEGQPTEEKLVGEIGELKEVSSIAVDNSSGASAGDIWVVVGGPKKEIEEFNPKLEKIGEPLKKFEKERFEAIEGLAVDPSGRLFVYQENGAIARFSSSGTYETSVGATGLELPAQPGFGVDSHGNFYGDHESKGAEEQERSGEEGRGGALVVAAKMEPSGTVVNPALEVEQTTGLTVNAIEGKLANELNDAYLVNDSIIKGQPVSTVAQLSETGALIQRYGAPGLTQGDAIAVDPSTGAVYVADLGSKKVYVFTLEGPGAPSIDSLSAETAPPSETTPAVTKLIAQVNPHGVSTNYRFEFGSSPCHESGCATPAGGSGTLNGFGDQTVSVELPPGLGPGTYYYRVVAENTQGKAESAEQLPTGEAMLSGLPDGRAWEMVSPPNKDGNEPDSLTDEGGVIQAADAGGAMTFVADGPMPASGEVKGVRSPENNQILSHRTPEGWVSQDITTPNEVANGVTAGRPSEYQFFTPDLTLGVAEPYPGPAPGSPRFELPPLSPPVSAHETELASKEEPYREKTLYLRSNSAGGALSPEGPEREDFEAARHNGEMTGNEGFLAVMTNANAPGGGPFGGGEGEGVKFLGANPDLSHVVFKLDKGKRGIYEWGASEKTAHGPTERELEAVSVAPGAEEGAIEEGFLGGPEGRDATHAISNDGSLVVWTSSAHLYVRDTQSRETIQVDAVASGASGSGEVNPVFQTAGEEEQPGGTKVFRVFFTDPQRLTANSHAVSLPEERPDLYVFELKEAAPLTGSLTDLTPEGEDGRDADVVVDGHSVKAGGGVIAASEDGRYVYFVANGALAPNSSRGHCGGEGSQYIGGTCNLFVLHFNGSEWEPKPKLVAVLSEEDRPDWGGLESANGDPGRLTAGASPDGQYLAFMSNRSLTGYDNEDVTSKKHGERMDEEVFLYNVADQSLVCASCNINGSRPQGVYDAGESQEKPTGEGIGLVVDRPQVWAVRGHEPNQADHWLAGSIPGWTQLEDERALYRSRYISDQGRLYFNGAGPLVPMAAPTRNEEVKGSEERVGVENVYEFEPNGSGTCAAGGGCLGLLSSGTSEHESAFLDASASGNDVYFLTAAQLPAADGVVQDVDSNFDIYDAHVCEPASPCSQPVLHVPTVCEQSPQSLACTGQAPGSPAFGVPAGVTSPSSGNVPKLQVLPFGPTSKPAPKPETKAQKLVKALKACRKKYKGNSKSTKHKRAVCEAQAHKKYGTKKKAKK